jgi:hypothetical protein
MAAVVSKYINVVCAEVTGSSSGAGAATTNPAAVGKQVLATVLTVLESAPKPLLDAMLQAAAPPTSAAAARVQWRVYSGVLASVCRYMGRDPVLSENVELHMSMLLLASRAVKSGVIAGGKVGRTAAQLVGGAVGAVRCSAAVRCAFFHT